MSTTIDSLSIQITSSAGGAATEIDALATALGRLKANSSLTKVKNNLTKLSEALDTLKTSSSGLSSLDGLATTLETLAGIQKLSGLNSAMNALKKLPEIIKGLDDSTLSAFGAKMTQLSASLGPVATQIEKIGRGFSKLPANITKATAATNKMGQASHAAASSQKGLNGAINTTSLNLATAITNIYHFTASLNWIVQGISNLMADAVQWDGIQFRFGRAFGEDAEDVYEWAQKINEALDINIQQFMQYSSLYGSLLKGFGLAQEQVTTISVGLTELSYDIWAAYNDRYTTLEDASEAIRSAITGEIEPIRNAGIPLTEASMQEFVDSYDIAAEKAKDIVTGLEEIQMKAAETGELEPLRKAMEDVESQATETKSAIVDMMQNGISEEAMQAQADIMGLGMSVQNMTEAQKAELRYAVMVNAAMNQGIVGTYAREMETAEGAIRRLSQQLKTLGQAFGSLFIPVLQAVLPWISAFVDLLYDAVAAIANLFGVKLFEINWGDSTSGVGSVTESADEATGALGNAAKAAKKLKDYTMGFDELNIIQPDVPSGGSGGGAGAGTPTGSGGLGLDLDTLWNQALLDEASKQVDEIKEKILGFFDEWKTEIAIIGAALGALTIASLLTQLGNAIGLGDKFTSVMGGIKKLAATAIIITLQFSLMTEFLGDYMSEDGTIWDLVKAALVGGAATWVLYSMWGPAGLVIGFGVTAAASLKAIIDNGGINSTESAVTALLGIASAIAGVGVAWKKLMPILKASNLGAFFALLGEGNSLVSVLAATFPKLSSGISGATAAVSGFLGLSVGATLAVIAGVIVGLVSVVWFLKENWDAVTAAVQGFFQENIAPKLEEIKGHWENLKEALGPVGVLFEWLGEKVGDLIDWFKELGGLGVIFEALGGLIFSTVGGAIATAFNIFVGLIENMIQVWTGFGEIIGGVVDFIVALFTGGDIGAAWEQIWDGVVDVASGIWGMLTQPFQDFWDGIIGWFTNLWDELVGHSIVPDTIDAIVECFTDMPGEVLDAVAGFYSDIVGWFDGLWSEITGWFDTNFDVAGQISEKWEAGKNWWNTRKQGLSTYTPAIGSIKDKVSSAWSTAKTWWGNKKGDMKTYTPSIGSIKDKVSSAWDTAKTWWNNSKSAMKSYTPSIGSIYDKVKERWDNAKTWWNNKKTAMKSYTPSIGSIYEKLKERWDNAKNWWNNTRSGLSFTPSVGSIKEKLKSAWNSAKSWWNNNVKLSIPSLSFQVTYTPKSSLGKVKKAIVNALDLPGWPKLSFAASGGIFDMGSLVWAGEKGPEIVANAGGGKTGVMNIDQMQQAVYEGVAAAMTAVMRGSGGGGEQAINIYLDGKQITASVEKRQKERGASIMGTQIYSYA